MSSSRQPTFRDLEPDVFIGGGHFGDAVLFTETAKALNWAPKAIVIIPARVVRSSRRCSEPMPKGEWFGTATDHAARTKRGAALSLMVAIENAGSIDTEAVRQALYDLDTMTFCGPTNFDDARRNVAKLMGVTQIQDGVVTVVAPPQAATAPLLYPMPPWNER